MYLAAKKPEKQYCDKFNKDFKNFPHQKKKKKSKKKNKLAIRYLNKIVI